MKLNLPGNKLYNSDNVILNDLTLSDIDELSQASQDNSLESIIKSYSSRLKGIDSIYDLTLEDFFYITISDKFILPETSFSLDTSCPDCGNSISYNITYDDIQVEDLNEKVPSSGELGFDVLSGSKLYIKIPRLKDFLFLNKLGLLKFDINTTKSKLSSVVKLLPLILRTPDKKYFLDDVKDIFSYSSEEFKILKEKYNDNYDFYLKSKLLSISDLSIINYIFDNYFNFGVLNKINLTCSKCSKNFSVGVELSLLETLPSNKSREFMESRIHFDEKIESTDTGNNEFEVHTNELLSREAEEGSGESKSISNENNESTINNLNKNNRRLRLI